MEGERRRRSVLAITVIVLAPLAAGYAVLWLGGAIEVATDHATPLPWCSIGTESTFGEEEVDWFGGGILGRPGRVCVLGDQSEGIRTWIDVLAGVAAPVAIVGTILLWDWWDSMKYGAKDRRGWQRVRSLWFRSRNASEAAE